MHASMRPHGLMKQSATRFCATCAVDYGLSAGFGERASWLLLVEWNFPSGCYETVLSPTQRARARGHMGNG